jgi:tRNA A37 N6-isopentenylltransferase MiaA
MHHHDATSGTSDNRSERIIKSKDESIKELKSQIAIMTENFESTTKMLSQIETEQHKTISDLKKSKVYAKLCENKIKSLENELLKYFRIEIDHGLIAQVQKIVQSESVSHDILAPYECLFYPNQSFFKNNKNLNQKITFVGELKPIELGGTNTQKVIPS